MKLHLNGEVVEEIQVELEGLVDLTVEDFPLVSDVHRVPKVFLAHLLVLPFQGVAALDRTSEQALDLMELPALALRLHVVECCSRLRWGQAQFPLAKGEEYVLRCRYAIVLIILRTNIEFPTNRITYRHRGFPCMSFGVRQESPGHVDR